MVNPLELAKAAEIGLKTGDVSKNIAGAEKVGEALKGISPTEKVGEALKSPVQGQTYSKEAGFNYHTDIPAFHDLNKGLLKTEETMLQSTWQSSSTQFTRMMLATHGDESKLKDYPFVLTTFDGRNIRTSGSEIVKAMDKLTSQDFPDNNRILFRGVRMSPADIVKFEQASKADHTISFPSWSSFSYNEKTARDFSNSTNIAQSKRVIFELRNPKGMKVFDYKDIQHMRGELGKKEEEVLTGRNQPFKVEQVEHRDNGLVRIIISPVNKEDSVVHVVRDQSTHLGGMDKVYIKTPMKEGPDRMFTPKALGVNNIRKDPQGVLGALKMQLKSDQAHRSRQDLGWSTGIDLDQLYQKVERELKGLN